jgi:hydroxyquinol 1,2-dioxygenase
MVNFTNENLTDAVVASFDGCPDPRLKFILTSLVRHAHAFVRDVGLTEPEWFAAIRYLTATGQICDERRQEFILLSDVLGISMLVDAINHEKQAGETQSTVLGPFYVQDAPEMPLGADIAEGTPGTPLCCQGTISGADGLPLSGAIVDIWQSDSEGFYDVQKTPAGEHNLRGRFRTGADGRYGFWSILPSSYPIPADGPVGRLLEAAGRHPFRPAHVHFMIDAPGYEKLVTHVFVAGDPYLQSDAVFGVKDALIAEFQRRPAKEAPGGKVTEGAFFYLAYDFRLTPKGGGTAEGESQITEVASR